MHDRASKHGVLAGVASKRREELGLRQSELADLADCSTRFVHAVETGKPTIQLDKLVDLLGVLGFHLSLERGQAGAAVSLGPSLIELYGSADATA